MTNTVKLITILLLITMTIGTVSAQKLTGCVDTTRGVFYNFQNGSVPLNSCRIGDFSVSLYEASFVDNQVNNLTSHIDNITNQINNLTGQVNNLTVQVDNLTSQLNITTNQVNNLTELFTNVSRSENDIYFDNMNVHIRSGTGSTESTVNGFGNLIIGYNEMRNDGTDNRTGSNNLVTGMFNNYRSFGGVVSGFRNEISDTGTLSSVLGGILNTATGKSSSILGGNNNIASGEDSTISGGTNGVASGVFSSISGGENNLAVARGSSVTSGFQNVANGPQSAVTGGGGNTANGVMSTVSGGHTRTSPDDFNWVAGGLFQSN